MADTSKTHDAEMLAARSAEALRELEARAQSAIAKSREQAAEIEAAVTNQLEAIVASVANAQQAENETATDIAQLKNAHDSLVAEYAVAKEQWAIEKTELESVRDELNRQAANLEAEQKRAREEWARQLSDFELKLREQHAAWDDQRTEWGDARAALESERDEVQQKFTLALEDVQRYRERIGDLEQELSSRPEANASDSAELVALRAERDALAERIEALENTLAIATDPHTEQQMADLQRRFELAVEDVRELKTKNAALESQLAATAANNNQSSHVADSGGMDWESQKRRLLASLEDEGEPEHDPDRQQERTRISKTIEMTDTIIAQKDREIKELKSQIEHTLEGATCSIAEENAQRVNELLDADEVIAEHRAKIAQMERETEAALRAAELELSVERAKIARERVEIDESRAELELLRQEVCPNGAPAPGAPRRRWLSKLGLSGDE